MKFVFIPILILTVVVTGIKTEVIEDVPDPLQYADPLRWKLKKCIDNLAPFFAFADALTAGNSRRDESSIASARILFGRATNDFSMVWTELTVRTSRKDLERSVNGICNPFTPTPYAAPPNYSGPGSTAGTTWRSTAGQ